MPSGDGLVLISADSHVTEDPELWGTRLPQSFRERAPRFGPRRSDGHPGGTDPNFRVPEMEQDGVTAEVLYPSKGMQLYSLEDAALQEACFGVYNDWLLEYCSVAPDRLYGIGLLPTYNIDRSIKELERCRNAGMPGAMVWMAPHPSIPFHSDHYDRLWSAAQDMEVPISLHILTGFDYSASPNRRDGLEHYRGTVNHKIAGMANSLFDLIFSGVMERFPRLRFVLVETEIGWLPFYLQQWDYYFERFRKTTPLSIDKKPSEYFFRQVYATFFNDPAGCQNLTWWGTYNCMWSTDYPHGNSPWPHSREVMHKQLGHLPEQAIQKLVYGNVVDLYRLNAPAAAASV